MSALRNKIFGTSLALGTAFGAIATTAAAEQDNSVINAALPSYETVDRDTAKARSIGGITLYFGEGFSEISATAYTEILTQRGYQVSTFKGGPLNELTLCIDGGCLDQNFTQETSSVLTQVVDHLGSHLVVSTVNPTPNGQS